MDSKIYSRLKKWVQSQFQKLFWNGNSGKTGIGISLKMKDQKINDSISDIHTGSEYKTVLLLLFG